MQLAGRLRGNMKRFKYGVCMIACMMALTACTEGKTTEETTVAIDKKGKISSVIVDEFGQDYYSEEDLKNFTLAEVNSYNGEHGDQAVTLSKVEGQDEQVVVRMEYASAEDYAAFNRKQLFVGTVAQAYEAGYSLDVALSNTAESDQTIGKSEILEMGNKNIVIAEENILYQLPSKALYISGNGEMLKNTVVKKLYTEQESMLYIIY